VLCVSSGLLGGAVAATRQNAASAFCHGAGAFVELTFRAVGFAVQEALSARGTTGFAVAIVTSELAVTVLPTCARAVGALAITVGSFLTLDVTRTRAALECAGGILAASARAIGTSAATRRRIGAVHVARWSVTTEVTRAVLAAGALAVGARPNALVVVAAALDVTRRSLTIKLAIRPCQANARLVSAVGLVGASQGQDNDRQDCPR
jgi:hypothetical protein